MAIQAAVGVPDQLQGHRVDPGDAGHLPRGQLGQSPVVGPWQVAAGVPDLPFDEVEVVQEQFRRRGHELALVDVDGEEAVGLTEDAGVVLEAGEERADVAARIPGQGEAGGQGAGSFLQALDAQELRPEGFLRLGARAPSEEAQP
jgi:hypothetical protein